ncbi:flippase [candidate division KSB1 bacterium]|nr:flippase [candidate division KSB1 bacterium]NIR72199.1 flippase [candidate division KSB1 bacterium]NIS26664.1 flippase [candidate division KSB1 bacterium]NIT73432.1 flippase [candidate division KSB1 bacterium]NIU27280.1 flippase [candidate division KSB1 bacterium]
MKPSRVTSNSILVLSSEIIDRFLRFVLVIFAARLLGDADYGKITFAIAFGALFLILADFGLHQLLIREIARTPEDVERLMGNGLLIKLLLSGFTAFCIYVAAQLTNKPQDVMYTVYIIGASQITGSFAEYFSTVFQGMQRMKYVAIASLILSISNTVIGVLVLVLGGSFLTLAWVYLVSRMLKLIYCLVAGLKFTKIVVRFESSILKFLLLEGAVFGILRFFSIMYTNVDTTMLSLMIGDETVGWYNAAYRLIFAMMVIPIGIMRAVYPALSAYYKSKREAFNHLFEKTFKLLFWAGTSIAIVVSLLSDEIVLLIFGEEYINGAAALKILVWSTAIYFIGTTLTHATRSAGKQAFTAKVVATSAFLNLILNFILIPRYSLVGAAFATVMSEFFTFGFHLWFVGRYITKPPFLRLLPKVLLINLATGIFVWLMIDLSLFMTLGLVGLGNVGVVFLSRYFTKDELLRLQNVMKSLRGSQI